MSDKAVVPVKYEAARKALREAKSVDEVKQIHEEAAAMEAYARMAKDRELENIAIDLRLRAQRGLGKIMEKQRKTIGMARPRSGKGQRKHDRRVIDKPDGPPTLAEAGIDKNLAHAARWTAGLTEKEFEAAVKDRQERADRLGLRVHRRPAPAPPVVDVEPEPEPEPPTPEEYRENFMARVDAAMSYAVYEGPLLDGWTENLALWARDVAERWTKLAERLEGAMTGPPR